MADDTRDPAPALIGLTNHPATPTSPSTKQHKGVVLGKDGKPCRSCNSFSDFKKSTTPLLSHSTLSPTTITQPSSCPPDVALLGRSSWTLLHTLTASYPTNPSFSDRQDMSSFLSLFAKLYPCWTCAEDFQVYMERNQVRTESREEFGRWMCEAHNEVNRKLGKGVFDCAGWERRWRTGGEGC